jgi:hypothetical protein
MPRFLVRARFAVIVAAGLGLLISGVAAGAAGSALIIGSESNNAGTSNTSLATNSTVVAFRLLQNGAGGTALMGYVTPTNGPARGVYGRVDSADGAGVVARNAATTSGSGAAIQAFGINNVGIDVTSDGNSAIVADGVGFGAIIADGSDALTGVLALGGAFGSLAFVSDVNQIGAAGWSSLGIGVQGSGPGGNNVDYATWDEPGGEFTGDIGLIGQTDGFSTPGSWSRGVLGIATVNGVYGVVSEGDAKVVGDLTVTGTCTGCAVSMVAQNGASSSLRQGDAVTLLGVTTAADGSIAMVVGPAKKGDTVVGIVDTAIALTPEKVRTNGHSRQFVPGKGVVMVDGVSKTVTTKDRKWLAGATTVKSDEFVRVITSGIFASKAPAPAGAAAGDPLAVDAKAGKLGKAGADSARGAVAGTFLGTLKDGRTVILVGTR